MNRLGILTTILLLSLATSAFAVSRDEAATAVTERYPVTTPGFLGGFKEIGSVLTPRREGLRAGRPSKTIPPNVVESGRLIAAGGGDLPLGDAHDGNIKPGEKLHLYGVATGDDFVQLDLQTVKTYVLPGGRGPTTLQASLRFRYPEGLARVSTVRLMGDIGDWLATAEPPRPTMTDDRPAPAPVPRPADSGTATVRLGQTPAEVTAIFGPPEKEILLGNKTVFVYRNLKVIFQDGRVVDAE